MEKRNFRITAHAAFITAEETMIHVFQNGRICGQLIVDSAFADELVFRIEGRADHKGGGN